MRARNGLWVALLLGISVTAASGDERGYVVVLNPNNPVSEVERRFLSDAFLKKVTVWPNGLVIRPVDQESDSPARRRFSQDVIGRSVSAVKNYWQQLIFSGRNVPPPELNTDAEVLQYVLKNPAAVGYVSPNAELGGAKRLTIK